MALKDLIDKRKDMLFTEIGALIHDLGKLSKEFVEGKDDYDEKDNDNVKKFRHEKIFVSLNFLIRQLNKNQFLKRLIELILKKQPLKRFNDLKGKINSVSKDVYSADDFPQWAKNDSNLRQLGTVSKKDLDNFIQQLSINYVFLKYFYMKSQFFVLSNNLLEQVYSIRIENWPMVLLPLQHHRNDKKAFDFDITNLPQKMKLILAPEGADGIDSAIDKMVTNHEIAKQSQNHTFISTAFGYENQKIDLNLSDTDNNSLSKIRNNYAEKLTTILENLKNNPDNIQIWIQKREELLKETRKAFLNALGETRRPANDVTLWDHSFSVASLYKSALAEVVINRWKEPKDIKWKLLGIRFDGDVFYSAVPKIADVLGRKVLVRKILDNIKILLEMIIPLGNEIYRDENGSVFLVPESCDVDKILDINNELWDSIKDIKLPAELDYRGNWNKKNLEDIVSMYSNIKELIEELSSSMSEGIFIPQIILSAPSRGALNLGKIISEGEKWDFDTERLKQKWNDKSDGYEKCTVCNLKPVPLTAEEYENLKNKKWNKLTEEEKNSVKAFERKECLDCLKLSSNRVGDWWKNKKWHKEEHEKPSFDTSIWLDEVADENNKIGLIYLKFDLEKWLNGEMLNTFLSNPLLEEEFKRQFENELFNVPDYNRLIELLEEAFNNNDFTQAFAITKKAGNNLTVKELFQKFVGDIYDNSPGELFQSFVENKEPDWQDRYLCPLCATKGDNKHKAMVFLLLTTKKHPSFARLRRIWETTRNFGIEMFNMANRMLEQKKRYIFEFSTSFNLKITHTYYLKDKNDNKTEIVILNNNKASIISASKDFKLKNGDSFEICSDKYFNEHIGNLTISNFLEKSFTPIIPYQFEPSNTVFFVPLKDKTWEIITEIKKQYEIQFNKVQNRLPIKIGFVAFHKRTPMYAVLDAATRLMSQKEAGIEVLEITNITEMDSQKKCHLYEGKIGNKVKEIKLEDGETYYFSYSTADPNKEDLFHPYFVVQNNNGWKVPVDGKWKTIKHVKHLQKGDNVEFYPSYFDFLYLDTNTRRLDVGIERKHWLFKVKSPKPYRLKKIEEFERLRELLLARLKLTPSQLLNAYELLIDKMQHWEIDKADKLPIEDSIFKDFVENIILSNPFRLKIRDETGKGQITDKDFEFLKSTMLNGVFFDFIDMWHTVLKRKFKED